MNRAPRKWSLLYLILGVFGPIVLLLGLLWWFSLTMRDFDVGR